MRNRPVFQPNPPPNPDPNPGPGGCLWALIVTIGGYFVFMAINRVLAGEASRTDPWVCSGALAGFVILVILALRQERREKKQRRAAKQAWTQACQSAEVAIVNRSYSPSSAWEDEYGIPHSSRASYHLALAPTAEQGAFYPNLPAVSVDVYADTYTKLLDRNAVRIYYQPEAPMTFLLEEELDENP
jgi:hypothetical protein